MFYLTCVTSFCMISSFCKKIKLLGHFSGVFVKSLNLPVKKIVAYGQNFIVLQMTKYRTNNLAIWSHCIWSHCIWPSAVGKYPVDCIKTCLSNYRPFPAAASFLFKQEKKQVVVAQLVERSLSIPEVREWPTF